MDRIQRIAASQARANASPSESSPNWTGKFTDAVSQVGSNAKSQFMDNLSESSFGKVLRAFNLLPDAQPEEFNFGGASWAQNSEKPADWRVRLSVPPSFASSSILAPLIRTNGLIWPYTPQIYVTHSAAYTPIKPIHSNYPFFAYQNSQVDSFSITGDFFVENALEGQYWVAAVHFLRSVSKMAYGNTPDQGNPPPVIRLNGYGDYVFKNVPVVVTQFAVEMNQDVDYIFVEGLGTGGTYAPTRSNIQVTVQPIYSRRAVESFSLRRFVNGGYIGNGGGFI
tara:strand:- start:1284 stop:2126 length:843 start_codon:yes stop_codon:yes gene_type:complete